MQAAAHRSNLADALLPGSGLLRDAALVIGFAALVALFAQIAVKLPFTPVPITGQTLAVLLTGGALGANRGAASLALYAVVGLSLINI
ncbi:MAG: biotin transporter BioY, partial [Chloroflexota bacterium]|nr:biotin transporter BioY [Chloroflexota bacterium]